MRGKHVRRHLALCVCVCVCAVSSYLVAAAAALIHLGLSAVSVL